MTTTTTTKTIGISVFSFQNHYQLQILNSELNFFVSLWFDTINLPFFLFLFLLVDEFINLFRFFFAVECNDDNDIDWRRQRLKKLKYFFFFSLYFLTTFIQFRLIQQKTNEKTRKKKSVNFFMQNNLEKILLLLLRRGKKTLKKMNNFWNTNNSKNNLIIQCEEIDSGEFCFF